MLFFCVFAAYNPFNFSVPKAPNPILRAPAGVKDLAISPDSPNSSRMNTCKSVSKQRTLTTFRINTC